MKLVISAENGTYLAWQALTCARSWSLVSGERAVIVVHETGAPLHPIFQRARELAEVVEAPGFRGATNYAPRNHCGTLLVAAERFPGEDLVLVDPDMIFVSRPKFSGKFGGLKYTAMTRERIRQRAEQAGVRVARVERWIAHLSIGVPLYFPSRLTRDLAVAWLAVLDSMCEHPKHGDNWDDEMYALSFAALELGEVPEVGPEPIFNHRADGSHETQPREGAIHYCAVAGAWDKRQFRHDHDLADLWRGQSRLHGVGEPGSVLGEVLAQIRATGREFGFTT